MIYLHLDSDTASTDLEGTLPVSLAAVLGNTQTVEVACVRGGVVVEAASGATGKLVVKQRGEQSGDSILLDTAWESNDEADDARVYSFEFVAVSAEAQAVLDALEEGKEFARLTASVEVSENDVLWRCHDFAFTLWNSSARGEADTYPHATDESFYLRAKEVLVAGHNITLDADDTAETITVNSVEGDHGFLTGLADDDHPQYLTEPRGDARYTPAAHATASNNPHAVTKAQVGLGNVDDTADDDKPISTATQTALDAKADTAATQTALATKADAAATQTALATKAPLASPALTGTPTAPTALTGDSSTQIATTALVTAKINALIAAAPGTLDTLGEIAAQLASDESAAAALTTTVAGKEPAQTAASQAEAEAGTETAIRKWSPLRVMQAVTAKLSSLFATQAQAEAGTDNTRLMTPLRTAQAIAALGSSGGGSALVRGSGILRGYTTGEVATAFASTVMSIENSSYVADGSLTFFIDGIQVARIVIGSNDPLDGSLFIYNNSVSLGASEAASSIIAVLVGHSSVTATTAYPWTGNEVNFTLSGPGTLTVSIYGFSATFDPSSTVSGTSYTPASGEVTEVELVPAVAGKAPRLITGGVFGLSGGVNPDMELCLKLVGNYYTLDTRHGIGNNQKLPLLFDGSQLHLDGMVGASVVARITGDVTGSPIGGAAKFWCIAEQV